MSAADLAAYIGETAQGVALMSLRVSHWLALSLAVCLILTMVVKRRVRWPHLVLSVLFAAWYPLDRWDAAIASEVGEAVTAYPWLIAVVWIVSVMVFFGGIMWLLGDGKREPEHMNPVSSKGRKQWL